MKNGLEKSRLNRPEEKNLKNFAAKKSWRLWKGVLTEVIVGAMIVGAAVYAIRAIGAGGQAGQMPKTDRVTMVGARDVNYEHKAASKKFKDGLKGQPPMQEGRQ